MKIERNEIAKKLNQLKSVIPSKPPVDCLKGVLFKDGTMTASNMEITVRASIDAEIERPFILTQKGIDIIGSLPDGEVEILPGDRSITIKMPGITNRVPTYPAEDFPEPAEIKEAEDIGVDADVLANSVNAVMYAVAVQNTNPVQTGMLFKGDGKVLNLVGCDGFQLAWDTVEYGEKVDMVVPRESLQEILKIGFKGEVKISFDSRHAIFRSGEFTVFTRLLEGHFMNYEKAFPETTGSVNVDRRILLSAIQRAGIFSDKVNALRMVFEGDALNITVHSPDGDYNEDISLLGNYEGRTVIWFNPRYLQNALKSTSADEVKVSLAGTVSPMIVSGGTMKVLILPVKPRATEDEGGDNA